MISKIVHENTSIFVRYLSVKGAKTTDKIEKVTKRLLLKNGITEPFMASCEISQIAKFRFRNEQAAGSSPITSSIEKREVKASRFFHLFKYSFNAARFFSASVRPIS